MLDVKFDVLNVKFGVPNVKFGVLDVKFDVIALDNVVFPTIWVEPMVLESGVVVAVGYLGSYPKS